MCRFIAYLGPSIRLHDVLYAPQYSLLKQSYAPRMQALRRMNADGFGAGWYDVARAPEPTRYRSAQPMWADEAFESVARESSSGAILAAVRSASPGSPIIETNSHPFTNGPWLFTHNGEVDEFQVRAGAALRATLSAERTALIEGSTDSELLFALFLERVAAGASREEALKGVILAVEQISGGRLNLLLTDGHRVDAIAVGESLFVLERNDAIVVASEPFDDGEDWRSVPDRSLVQATPKAVSVRALAPR